MKAVELAISDRIVAESPLHSLTRYLWSPSRLVSQKSGSIPQLEEDFAFLGFFLFRWAKDRAESWPARPCGTARYDESPNASRAFLGATSACKGEIAV